MYVGLTAYCPVSQSQCHVWPHVYVLPSVSQGVWDTSRGAPQTPQVLFSVFFTFCDPEL